MDEAAVAEFGAVHRGPVIGPTDVRFDRARRSFNALIVEDAYGAPTFARLQAAKRTWDPGNLFRHNHNIPPAA
jgi:hypothetical protein